MSKPEYEVVLVEEGTLTQYQGRRSYQKRTIRIDRIFEVRHGDEVVGTVMYQLVTRESGRRRSGVVFARWQSPAWTFRRGSGRWGRTTEAYSKKDAIQRLIDGHRREQENDHA